MKKRLTVKLGKKERGFTLIELLIVIAILGVLAAVVVPNVMGLFGRGGNQAYDSDKQTIQTAAASFWGDVHEGPDITTAPAAPTWGDNAANEGTGHYFPTSDGAALALVTDLDFEEGDYDAVLLYIDADADQTLDLGEQATTANISTAAMWMGLLVNTAAAPVPGGTADRSLAAPWTDENDLYLTEFPNSSSSAYNGNPDTPGGTYTWIVGANGRVYGAYSVTWDPPLTDGVDLPSATYWYAGFSGNYP